MALANSRMKIIMMRSKRRMLREKLRLPKYRHKFAGAFVEQIRKGGRNTQQLQRSRRGIEGVLREMRSKREKPAAPVIQSVHRGRLCRRALNEPDPTLDPARHGYAASPANAHSGMALLDPAVRFLRAKLSKKKVKWKKEFWVPFFVVNLVYFCTLNMMLMPFFPLAFALGSLLSILEFHFTRLRLKHLMYKPLVPYDAKDVGLFFTRLYLCSLFFGIVLSHFVLSSETFPRVLDLQPTTSEREIAAYAGESSK